MYYKIFYNLKYIKMTFEFYKDVAKKRRRRSFAKNWEQVWKSTQWYVNKSDCIANARLNWYVD